MLQDVKLTSQAFIDLFNCLSPQSQQKSPLWMYKWNVYLIINETKEVAAQWEKNGLSRTPQHWHLWKTNLSQCLRNANGYPSRPNSNGHKIRKGNKWSSRDSCGNPSNSKNASLYLTSESDIKQKVVEITYSKPIMKSQGSKKAF